MAGPDSYPKMLQPLEGLWLHPLGPGAPVLRGRWGPPAWAQPPKPPAGRCPQGLSGRWHLPRSRGVEVGTVTNGPPCVLPPPWQRVGSSDTFSRHPSWFVHAGFHHSPTRLSPHLAHPIPGWPGHKPPAGPSLLLCPHTPKHPAGWVAQLLPLCLGTRTYQRGTRGYLSPASAWGSCPGCPGHGRVQDFIGDSPWERGKSRESCTLSFLAWLHALLKRANVNR